MPIIEQLLIGPGHATSRTGRGILARSPGINREIATEIARLCEGWGKVPTEGLQRPVLMSLPLSSTLTTLSGRLFAVLRLSRGMDPLYHAIILSASDYAVFGYNPFALANEDVFIDEYTSELELIRGEIDNGALISLVSPLPSSSDVDFVDEALRHVLANGKLLLPLESVDERSDRFFALTIAAMPLALKQELRFASWATSEVNNYTLAATSLRGSNFEGWQRFLMTAVCGKMPAQTEQYIQSVKERLADGDLDGLEKFSLKGKVDLKFSADPVTSTRRGVLTSTVQGTARRRSVSARPPRPAVATRSVVSPNTAFRSLRSSTSSAEASERMAPVRRGARRRRGKRYSRTIVALFAFALVMSGGALLLRQSSLLDLKWLKVGDSSHSEGSLLGVVDVGSVYDRVLQEWLAAGLGTETTRSDERRAGLTVLAEQAGVPLHQQGAMFVQLAAEGVQQIGRAQREQQRLESLAQRGVVLEQELRRLVLGYYSLNEGVRWRDLGRLPDTKLTARWDSLKRRRSSKLQSAQRGLRIEGLLRSVHRARGQIDGTLQMILALENPRCDDRWIERLSRAAEAAPRGAGSETELYCGAARAVVQLKRAETQARVADLPFATSYPTADWPPAGVRKAIVAVSSAADDFPRGAAPDLLPAAATFYATLDTLERLAAGNDIADQSVWLQALEDNVAVRSDPATYGDHVERARLVLAMALITRGIEPATLPDRFFPGEDRAASLAFPQALNQRPDAAGWEQIAAESRQPFFVRWAMHEADRTRQAARVRTAAFDQSWHVVVKNNDIIRRQATAGEDWSIAYADLSQAIGRCQVAYTAEAADSVMQWRWACVTGLTEAISLAEPLSVGSVTVRLQQQVLTEPQTVSVELAAVDGSWRMVTDAVAVGPAAPAGSGWVGTGAVAWEIPLGPEQECVARVLAADGTLLTTAAYTSLRAGEGPGAMLRPRGGDDGSVAFRIDDAFWRQIVLPPLE